MKKALEVYKIQFFYIYWGITCEKKLPENNRLMTQFIVGHISEFIYKNIIETVSTFWIIILKTSMILFY